MTRYQTLLNAAAEVLAVAEYATPDISCGLLARFLSSACSEGAADEFDGAGIAEVMRRVADRIERASAPPPLLAEITAARRNALRIESLLARSGSMPVRRIRSELRLSGGSFRAAADECVRRGTVVVDQNGRRVLYGRASKEVSK